MKTTNTNRTSTSTRPTHNNARRHTRRRTITKQQYNMQDYIVMYIAAVFIAAIISIIVIYLLISLNLGEKKEDNDENEPVKTIYYYRLEEDDNGKKYLVLDKSIDYYDTNDSSYSLKEYEDKNNDTPVSSYYESVNEFTDLAVYTDVSVEQMENLICTYTKNHPDSLFIGSAESFIEASECTGLNPIFLFALAGQESGWQVSNIHRKKNNPYSINMIDSNINAGLTLGDTFNEGIINGAKWIKDHYYDNGQTSIYLMQYGNKRYASDDNWMPAIVGIMNNCYRILNDNL